jgi:hypothetical protein
VFVECKSTSMERPAGVLFPQREIERADQVVGRWELPYLVVLWRMEEGPKGWRPTDRWELPPPVQANVQRHRVSVTWVMDVG